MVTQENIRESQHGVTLIELMIGALVTVTIIAAGFAVAVYLQLALVPLIRR